MANRTPKYLAVASSIRQAIQQGDLNGRMPGERVLAKQHGVSYMTLRKAIDKLVDDQLLYRLPQRGTYVAKPILKDGKLQVIEGKTLKPIPQLSGGSLQASLGKSPREPLQSASRDDEESELVAQLRRENRELKRANDLLQRVASYLMESGQAQPTS